MTLPSPKTASQASSIVRILGQEMLFPIFSSGDDSLSLDHTTLVSVEV